jgi:uncharacterized membrane protein
MKRNRLTTTIWMSMAGVIGSLAVASAASAMVEGSDAGQVSTPAPHTVVPGAHNGWSWWIAIVGAAVAVVVVVAVAYAASNRNRGRLVLSH